MAQDDVFKALADPTRRKIIGLLRERDSMTAGEIAEQFPISKPAVSDHLKVLRNAGLIYAEKQGQFINYQLNATVLQELAALLLDLLKTGRKGGKR